MAERGYVHNFVIFFLLTIGIGIYFAGQSALNKPFGFRSKVSPDLMQNDNSQKPTNFLQENNAASDSVLIRKEETDKVASSPAKIQKSNWEKFFKGEERRDITSSLIPYYPAAYQKIVNLQDIQYPKLKGNLDIKGLLPKYASHSAFSQEPYFDDDIEFYSVGDKIKQNNRIEIEAYHRLDGIFDIALLYRTKLKGLEPETKYVLLVCQYYDQCNPSSPYITTDKNGHAEVEGFSWLNSFSDRLVVIRYSEGYGESDNSECYSVRSPCLIADLPKFIREIDSFTFPLKIRSNQEILQKIKMVYPSRSYVLENAGNLMTYKEITYTRPVYSPNYQSGLWDYVGDTEVPALEVKFCREKVRLYVDKYSNLLGFKYENCQ